MNQGRKLDSSYHLSTKIFLQPWPNEAQGHDIIVGIVVIMAIHFLPSLKSIKVLNNQDKLCLCRMSK